MYFLQPVASCLRSPFAATPPPALVPVVFHPSARSSLAFVHARWKCEYFLACRALSYGLVRCPLRDSAPNRTTAVYAVRPAACESVSARRCLDMLSRDVGGRWRARSQQAHEVSLRRTSSVCRYQQRVCPSSRGVSSRAPYAGLYSIWPCYGLLPCCQRSSFWQHHRGPLAFCRFFLL